MTDYSMDSNVPPALRREWRWPVLLAFPLALLVLSASLGGLMMPGTYALETPDWMAQAIAQDWIDLVVVIPLLLGGSLLALRGSQLGRVLLAGAMLFSAYSFVIYVFAVHFNQMYLCYCAALGLSAFGAAGLLRDRIAATPGRKGGGGNTVAGWFLIVVAVLFALLWLSEILPAVVGGTVPEKLVAVGLPANPVHGIDLSLFLPLQFVAGISLLRGQRLGHALAPVLLVFGAIMAAAIATIFVVSILRGLPGDMVAAVPFGVFSGLNLVVLVMLSRSATPAP